MQRLKELRKEKKLLQKDVASAVNHSITCISDWERGKREPSIDDLIRLADFFGVSIDYLVGREEDGVVIVSGNELSKDESALIDKMRCLDPLNKELAYQYIDFLTERQK